MTGQLEIQFSEDVKKKMSLNGWYIRDGHQIGFYTFTDHWISWLIPAIFHYDGENETVEATISVCAAIAQVGILPKCNRHEPEHGIAVQFWPRVDHCWSPSYGVRQQE